MDVQVHREARWFSPGRRAEALVVVLLVLVALAARLDHLRHDPAAFHPGRQSHSALIAREYYYEHLHDAPAWKRHIAAVAGGNEPRIEPPLLERAASLSYRAFGGERLWFPRLLSCLFWVAGGVFLYLTARRIASEAGALTALGTYLFLPYAVLASRSFQPDPLMVSVMLAAVFAIVRYDERASGRRLMAAGLVSGLAVLVKPGITLLPLMGAFLALGIARNRLKPTLTSRATAAFLALTTLPTAAYYLYGTVFKEFLRSQAGQKVAPKLLEHPFFWKGWVGRLTDVLSYPAGGAPFRALGLALLGVGLISFALLRQKMVRALVAGLALGYVAYGLVFNVHIYSADYYSLQFVPIFALAVMPLGELLSDRLRARPSLTRLAVPLMLLAGLAAAGWVAQRIYAQDQGAPIRDYQRIGTLVHHSDRTFVDAGDAEPLQYYGWFAGVQWPSTSDLQFDDATGKRKLSMGDRFAKLSHDKGLSGPPQFFATADVPDFQAETGLGSFLSRHFTLLSRSPGYLVYDLRHRRPSTYR